MPYNPEMFDSIQRRSWMLGLPERVKNVISAYGMDRYKNGDFSKNKLIADIESGVFLKRAINAGPKTVEIIKRHFCLGEFKRETITGVASYAYGKLYKLPKPYRHHDILDIIFKEMCGNEQIYAEEEGFITSAGRYVDRTEAYVIAHKAGQILQHRHHKGQTELYSESVW